MSKRMKCVILALMVGSCVLTGCGAEEVVEEAVMTPAQIKDREMSEAAYYDSFVVSFNMDTNGNRYGICNGTEKVVSLDEGETRRVELSSQQALNASICKWNEDAGRWGMVLDIAGVSPGDYLTVGASLQWTQYTP